MLIMTLFIEMISVGHPNACEELRDRLGLEDVTVLQRNREHGRK